MADNQKAEHGDSQSGQKNDPGKAKGQNQQGQRTFAQGGEGDQKQGNDRQSGKR